MSDQTVEYFPTTRPWREKDGRLSLIGMTCAHCGTRAFPARDVCSGCGRDDRLEEVELDSAGTLYTFSEVHVGPKGFPTPYVIGYVDLDAGVRVLAQINGTAADLKVGERVTAHVGPIRQRGDGTDVISYRFGRSA